MIQAIVVTKLERTNISKQLSARIETLKVKQKEAETARTGPNLALILHLREHIRVLQDEHERIQAGRPGTFEYPDVFILSHELNAHVQHLLNQEQDAMLPDGTPDWTRIVDIALQITTLRRQYPNLIMNTLQPQT